MLQVNGDQVKIAKFKLSKYAEFAVSWPLRVLVLGASYGLLPGVKLGLAGHRVSFVGRREEIALIAERDLEVSIPHRRANEDLVLRLPVAAHAREGAASITTPDNADPSNVDFVIFAMQEPQYADPSVTELVRKIAKKRLPILSIMNLPPPPFLNRLGIVDPQSQNGVYSSANSWLDIDPRKLTVASPDPQAIRSDPTCPGHLRVTLASNFKVAPFEDAEDQAVLERLANDFSRIKVAAKLGMVRPPVALLASNSRHVPLSKWPMLITGNCRCIQPNGTCSIFGAVMTDVEASSAIYDQVCMLVKALGAPESDIVSFSAYTRAASQLNLPSSLARALMNGATNVERIDKLVLNLMRINNFDTSLIEPISNNIQAILDKNRLKSI